MSEESLASKIAASATPEEPQGAFQVEADEVEIEQALESEGSESSKPQDNQFASKFAALTRKEKAAREREAELERRIAEIEAREKALEDRDSQYSSIDDFKRDLLKNPLKYLNENDITFEKLTEMQLNEGNPTPEMLVARMQQEMESKFEERLSALAEEYEEDKRKAAEQRYEEVIQDYVDELADFVNESVDEEGSPKYELVKLNNAVPLVYEVVEAHHEETGKILSNDEACQLVEQYFEDEAKKLFEAKKFASRKIESEQQGSQERGSGESTTLSNDHTTDVGTSPAKLSREQSLEQAAKLIRWE